MSRLFQFIALFLLSNSITVSHAKDELHVIRAGTSKAYIVEGADNKSDWYLSPETKPDCYTLTKHATPQWIRFYTDIDSIKVQLKPGEQFDFVVVLQGKDSCYTRFQSPPLKNYAYIQPAQHDTLPFTLTAYNNIKVKAVLNGQDTLELKFDSGTTGLLLTRDAIKNKTHLAGNSRADNTLTLGSMRWDSLRIYPVELSGQGTDGRFGWDLFDGKVVEIDYDKNLFIVHPQLPPTDETYARFAIEYTHTLFCIRAALQVKGRQYANRFLFDNGYQRTIMLDTILISEQGFPKDLPVLKKVIMKNGQGQEIPVLTVNNEQLNLGQHVLRNIPVQLMTTANPTGFKTHILGNEVLKRFNTLLDFQHNEVYLKPNSLYNLPYTDGQQ